MNTIYYSLVFLIVMPHLMHSQSHHLCARKRHLQSFKKIVPLHRQLLDAARTNNITALDRYLTIEANPNLANENGETALHLAAQLGHIHIVEALLTAGSNTECCMKRHATHRGVTPLFLAVERRHTGIVQALLQAGAHVQPLTSEGITPLHSAAARNYLDILHTLLSAKANPSIENKQGASPLCLAAQAGHIECMEALITAGASLLPHDPKVITPLERLHNYLHDKTRAPHPLLSPTQINRYTNYLQRLIHRLTYLYPCTLGSNGDTILHRLLGRKRILHKLAKTILQSSSPALLNHKNMHGRTVLHVAAHQPAYIKRLVRKGANPAATTPTGDTVYSLRRSPKITHTIDNHDTIDIAKPDSSQWTRLMHVAYGACSEDKGSMHSLQELLNKADTRPMHSTDQHENARNVAACPYVTAMIQEHIKAQQRKLTLRHLLKVLPNLPEVLADLLLQFSGTYEPRSNQDEDDRA